MVLHLMILRWPQLLSHHIVLYQRQEANCHVSLIMTKRNFSHEPPPAPSPVAQWPKVMSHAYIEANNLAS